MAEQLPGGCLCGAVKFTAVPVEMEMDACHCSKCRKWSGGALLAVPSTEFQIEDETKIASYQSSAWGERVFCKTCGTNLFWRMLDHSVEVVMVQAFDDPTQFRFAKEAFIDEKPDNYAFGNDTQKMTGAEFMAIYSPEES